MTNASAAFDAGIRYFDVAPLYGFGLAEHRIGQAARKWPRDFVLSTKVGRLLRPVRDRQPSDMYVDPLPFEIVFDNMDAGIPHNVAIYTDENASTALFVGDTINGPEVITYEVPALDAGTYFFRCDVHPTTMTGTFVVA